MHKILILFAVTLGLLLTAGCDSTLSSSGAAQTAERRLRTVDNSEQFYAELREALLHQVTNKKHEPVAAFSQAGPGSNGVSAETDQAVGGDTGSDGSDGSATAGTGNEVSGTNIQEMGVDEADRVKTESNGDYLYVLENKYNDVYPMFVTPSAPGIAEPVGSFTAEAVSTSFAPQNVSARLRILALDAAAPDAMSVNELELDLGGSADGLYLFETSTGNSVIITSSGLGGGHWGYWGEPYAFADLQSSITRIDVSNPSNAGVKSSLKIDGQIVSSRRIGKHLFVASRYYPYIDGLDPNAAAPELWRDTIENTDLANLLPEARDSAGAVAPLFDPANCFIAPRATADHYSTPDIITLSVVDLESMQLTDSECFLGATETLYASPTAVYLATTQWNTTRVTDINFENVALTDAEFVDPRVDTDIHQFNINGGQLNYAGSGVVSGHLGWDELRKPFRMSEKDGYLRVATYADRQSAAVSPINLTILKPNGGGKLATVSRLPNSSRPVHIGKPGEQLYASRFLGDKAYLVTFRQTDPLYVLDLSDPKDPYLLGKLEIAGYSDYLHPIDENYLLGIGKDAVPASDRWGDGRGALAQGIKLSLFNVTDPNVPTEVQSVVVGQRGSAATALRNHRAITVQAATDQHPTRVAFGIDVHGRSDPVSTPPEFASFWYPWNYSGLHGFEIKTGADAGITQTGVMITERATRQQPYGPTRGGDDRSILVNNSIYYIDGSDVYASPWDTMANGVGPR